MRSPSFIVLAAFLCLYTFSCKSKKEQAPDSATATTSSQSRTAPVGLNLGNTAPEITLNNPEGIPIPLSSLKGKVVLIDFWASWCGPCRFENPAVVQAYKKYHVNALSKKREFTVYSVSLDRDPTAWKKAIEKDSLVWRYHVSDLKGWDNEAALKYGVTSIPVNFLINEEGIIIDKNLRGEALLAALKKLEP